LNGFQPGETTFHQFSYVVGPQDVRIGNITGEA